MKSLIALVPLFPLIGFVILALFNHKMSKGQIAVTGAGSVGIAALCTIIGGIGFLSEPSAAWEISLWQWFSSGGLETGFSFQVDALTVVFLFIITFVGFLIHLYSTEFMEKEPGYGRFFAYMNLFVTSMLLLVLGNNLVLLYLGWEGVGLCSFLLIGFYYSENENGFAAQKAFIMTRIGDTAMAIGLFMLFYEAGTLNINEILQHFGNNVQEGDPVAVGAAALLLGGAVGKSAQLPLQTWLPDAMAGPSPVSALIHAATMVTAGVYLIARMHEVFVLSPAVQAWVAAIGTLTLLIAGFSALVQRDIKKVLAYSTISQIGYMFLALGVGAWSAAIFHFFTHAFFKALLFLGAGVVIEAMDDEHDMFKMGGLAKKMPVTFWTFLIGAASLAALPLVTSGFYSKDWILFQAHASPLGGTWLWLGGLLGAFITALYTFRMVWVTFAGSEGPEVHHYPGPRIKFVLTVLAVLSLLTGFLQTPHTLGHVHAFGGLLHETLPSSPVQHVAIGEELLSQLLAVGLTLLGLLIGYLALTKRQGWAVAFDGEGWKPVRNFLYGGWGFDTLYYGVFVAPVTWLAQINPRDIIDRMYDGIAGLMTWLHYRFIVSHNGQLRWYTLSIFAGAVILMTIALMV